MITTMKLVRSLSLILILSFTVIALLISQNFQAFAQGAYTITVKAKTTSSGVAKTYPSVIVTIMDAATNTPLSSNFANGASVELNTKPTSFWIKIMVSENGSIVHTHQSDIIEPGASDTSYTYNQTIEILNPVVGPVTTTTPSPGASGASPTPATGEIGYCGDDGPDTSKMLPVPAGTTPPCSKASAEWVKSTASDFKNSYCVGASGGLQPYFYKCPTAVVSGSPTPTKTPTPTPYTPIAEGKACVPSQGSWQCVSGNYCAQSCSSLSASCATGVCCRNGFVWSISANTCIAPVTTGTPAPITSPTPIATSGTCNDSIQTSSGTVSQICSSGTTCSGGAVKNPDALASESCSLFYSGGKDKTGYTCCQLPIANQSGAGSSCQVSGRLCDTSKNTVTGTNNQCSGCGGYCIKPSGATEAFCQSI